MVGLLLVKRGSKHIILLNSFPTFAQMASYLVVDSKVTTEEERLWRETTKPKLAHLYSSYKTLSMLDKYVRFVN